MKVNVITCGTAVLHTERSYPGVPGEQVGGAEEKRQKKGEEEHGGEGKGAAGESSLTSGQVDS